MPDLQEQLTREAAQAAGRAEAAAERAETTEWTEHWLVGGLLLALVGAILAFALKDNNASLLGVSLKPLGGVLLAAGSLMALGAAIGPVGRTGSGDAGSIQSVGGLIAVVAGITAVTALSIFTLTRLGSENKDSIVAVTTSAFGIISAVVGAYLGIKISADTSAKASDEAKHAAVAQHEVEITKHQVSALEKEAEQAAPAKAEQIKAAGYQAREEAARTQGAPPGGGGA